MMRSMQQPAGATGPVMPAMQPGAQPGPQPGLQPGAPSATAQPAGAFEVLSPEQAAQTLGVGVADVMEAINAGDLKARRIGSAWRIGRSALEEFLRG